MKTIAVGRQEGKTTLCIDYLKQHPNAHMIVWSTACVERTVRQHPELKGRVHTLGGISKGKDIEEFIIDNLDEVLRGILGRPVTLATWTQDDADTYTTDNYPGMSKGKGRE